MVHDFRTVNVIGLGYVGLPTAVLLASRGLEVHGVDINSSIVESINQGKAHIEEPELDAVLTKVVQEKKLICSTKPIESEVFVIAVPTPVDSNSGADLSYVRAATESIAPLLKRDNLVILESTSPVGTTQMMAEWLQALRPDLKICGYRPEESDLFLAYCPERVLPGRVFTELVENDRIIGGLTARCASKAKSFYSQFVKGACIETSAAMSEMTKLTENTFRDINIAFANELSLLCDRYGLNVWELIELANRHPRVNVLKPGPGVGGHCIAVDPWFLISKNKEITTLSQAARAVNDQKPKYVANQVKKLCTDIHSPVVACLGLSYKADIDDFRESPSVEIVRDLINMKIGRVVVVEPYIKNSLLESPLVDGFEFVDLADGIEMADVVVLLTDHRQFSKISVKDLSSKKIVDTRGVWLGKHGKL